jgi:Flp pilus assembly protein TadG
VIRMMKFSIGRLTRPLFRLASDRRGVSAVEFALILPLMMTLYLGGNELSHALTIARKVTHVTSSLGDLITQSKTITDADMANILNAATAVMTPYPTGLLLKIKVSGIDIDATGKATVAWSDAQNDTALTVGAVVTNLPAAVKTPSTFIVTAEVHYAYTPAIGYVLTGTFDLKDQFYLRPRLSDCISRPPVICT